MPKRATATILALVLSILLTGCGGAQPTLAPSITSEVGLPSAVTPTPPASSPTASPTSLIDLSPEALAYLEEALDIMQGHSLNREQIEWERLRGRARSRALGASTPEDTYLAIQFTLRDLGDHHSHFMTPEQFAEFEEGTMDLSSPDPSGRLLDSGIGYIMLPGFAGLGDAANEYATKIQEIIREIDAESPCGWVVDLRQNTGGSMWPMLAGIGPILGEGRVGAFVSPDGEQIGWTYKEGQAWADDLLQTAVTGTAYALGSPYPPVAVLTGPRTSSSGEAIAVAFRGRPDTRSFGQATMGLSTANEGFELSDGAWVFLTVSVFADRTGQQYGGVIDPDEVVGSKEEELTLQTAVDWLLEQPACAAGGTEGRPQPTATAVASAIQTLTPPPPTPTWTPIAPSTYEGVRVTHVFNAGFLITIGDKRILIDALYKGYPEGILKPVVYSQPPFDGVDLILATHEHHDHFSPELVGRYMRDNPQTLFVSTRSAVDQLIAVDGSLRGRSTAIALRPGESEQLAIKGVDLEAIYISHGMADILNLGFIITVDGFKLFHTGDLSPDHVAVSDFQDYGLPGMGIDVAFVPHFLLTIKEYHAYILEGIQPRYTIPMHFPLENPPEGIGERFPNAFVFGETMESWFLP